MSFLLMQALVVGELMFDNFMELFGVDGCCG